MASSNKGGWRSGFRGVQARGGTSGIGRAGGRGRGKASEPCRNLQRTGTCRFGTKCTYSHELLYGTRSEASGERSGRKAQETPEQQQAKANYNSWKRLIKNRPKANDSEIIEIVWNDALNILNGEDMDWKQMLPRDLDNDEYYGRDHIGTTLSMVAHSHGHSTFIDLAHTFLSVFTHPALLDCLSVDTSVGGLYNFLSGTNGSRAIPFFRRLITSLLHDFLKPTNPKSTAELEPKIVVLTVALRELLKREQRAAYHENLPDLIDSMEAFVDSMGLGQQSVTLQLVRTSVDELRGVVARANGRLQNEAEQPTDGVSSSIVASTYPRELVLPRNHHDNDNMDITRINILPTEDEIRSRHPVFLPSTDRDQPHFLTESVQRHLDTQFRLYRHDCLDEVSEALGRALVAIEIDPAILESSKMRLGDIRAYTHPKANLRYIAFDRKRGLEAQISIPQPHALQKESALQRRKWWDESKRLDEGILLCLLFADDDKVSLLFFIASERCTDPKNDHGLTHDPYRATITVKLATHLESDLKALIQLSCQKQRGLLIEFPGILPATFIPILENLQNMQRSSRLPFRQWMLPDRGSDVFAIPPPLYARSPRFSFSLKSIMRNPGDDVSLASTTPVNSATVIDNLVARTGLDRGQCEALLAALLREYVFIQGPPGTGKSYLGVQIMRILLDCKVRARLGPIVVV